MKTVWRKSSGNAQKLIQTICLPFLVGIKDWDVLWFWSGKGQTFVSVILYDVFAKSFSFYHSAVTVRSFWEMIFTTLIFRNWLFSLIIYSLRVQYRELEERCFRLLIRCFPYLLIIFVYCIYELESTVKLWRKTSP